MEKDLRLYIFKERGEGSSIKKQAGDFEEETAGEGGSMKYEEIVVFGNKKIIWDEGYSTYEGHVIGYSPSKKYVNVHKKDLFDGWVKIEDIKHVEFVPGFWKKAFGGK